MIRTDRYDDKYVIKIGAQRDMRRAHVIGLSSKMDCRSWITTARFAIRFISGYIKLILTMMGHIREQTECHSAFDS